MSLQFLMQALKCALIVNITAYKSQIKSHKKQQENREEEADEVVKNLHVCIYCIYIFFFLWYSFVQIQHFIFTVKYV